MRIKVKVIPNATRERVEILAEDKYRVAVNAKPQQGMANMRMRKILAAHFGISESSICIAVGHSSKNKIIEIKGGGK